MKKFLCSVNLVKIDFSISAKYILQLHVTQIINIRNDLFIELLFIFTLMAAPMTDLILVVSERESIANRAQTCMRDPRRWPEQGRVVDIAGLSQRKIQFYKNIGLVMRNSR